ncbi:MAG: LysM peptidoglycan-binding domain-containing protein, partial [Chloroflexota bacterium]
MRNCLYLLCVVVLCVGCTDSTPTAIVVVTATLPPICGEWESSDRSLVCIASSNGYLAQSQAEQTIFRAYDLSITLSGTALIVVQNSITIQVLEGTAIISTQGQNSIIGIGQEANIPLVDGFATFPLEVAPILQRPRGLVLSDLPRPIDQNAFVVAPTLSPTDIPTPEQADCPPPDDWNGTYTIVSGDTLATIANRYDIRVDELASGNCLTNVARINVGQELVVPSDGETSNESIAIGFRADNYVINSGDCTILRWDAFGAQAIYLDDELVSESS